MVAGLWHIITTMKNILHNVIEKKISARVSQKMTTNRQNRKKISGFL